MSEPSANIIAWEEGEPAQTLLAPEQPLAAVASSRLQQVFFLTEDGRVYLSTLKQDGLSGKLQELALPCQCVVGVACTFSHTLFITDRGRVLQSLLATPEKVEELTVKKPELCCTHGVTEEGERLVIREMVSNSKHIMVISDSGKIWVIDEAKSMHPEIVQSFKNCIPISIACGNSFSVALIQDSSKGDDKSSIKLNDSMDGTMLSKTTVDSGCSSFVGSCSQCREQSLLSIQNLSLLDRNGDIRADDSLLKSNNKDTLAQVCWSKADHLVRQSALLLNSDAAKQFLTRQLSWVTGSNESGDDGVFTDPAAPTTTNKGEGNNVTQQVASRVVESVRTLGDAASTVVNRMSRHWSTGSSQEHQEQPMSAPTVTYHLSTTETIASESLSPAVNNSSFETLSLPGLQFSELSDSPTSTPQKLFRQVLERQRKWNRLGSSSLSLDSTMVRLRRMKSTIATDSIRPDKVVAAGKQLLSTSVWSWGHGGMGQLGQSDCVSRDQPTSLRHLQSIGVVKISCGSQHTLALTLDGRVFAWGANARGQIGPGEDLTFVSTPLEVALPFRTTVRDIATGREHSLLLTTHGEVLFLGFSLSTQKATLMRLNLPTQSPPGVVGQYNHRIWASGPLSCCLRSSHAPCCWPQLTELILSEQLFLQSCAKVSRSVFDQLDTSSAPPVRRELFERYRDLMACTAWNVHSLLEAPVSNCVGQNIALVRWIEEYAHLWISYGRALCNATAVNALVLNKTEALLLDHLWSDLLKRSNAPGKATHPLQAVMLEPIARLAEYSLFLLKLAESHKDSTAEFFTRAHQRCHDVSVALQTDCQNADITRAFWDSCSTKLADVLRTPERRLIRESRSHPISLANSGRFSSHWFILLTDVLIHVSGYSTHTAHPLSTIWVEPLSDSPSTPSKNCLSVIMPEESLTLNCPTPVDKMEWLKALQSAICQALKANGVSMVATSPTSGSTSTERSVQTTPPLVRSATYTFTKLPHLKDVTYSGAWLCGKMQGEGEMRWPDGRIYRGSFRQNLQYGFGYSESPGSNGTVYEGSWKDGKMSGYGVLKYANGDVYEGHFQDGQLHGHGTLKRGHFLTSAASVYVGQWEAGQKNGYGVMDDIVTGEKYMGLWQGDARHGQAVLVTLDGLYIEGTFSSGKMTGQCVMWLEDGTSYEGEVAGVGLLGGKGQLRLPNGDIIQGTFHGSFSDGIKINATLTKHSLTVATSPSPLPVVQHPTPYADCPGVPASRKWEAVFRQCCQALGLPPSHLQWTPEDGLRAWDQIAVIVNQSQHCRTVAFENFGSAIRGGKLQLKHRRQGSSVSSKSIKSDRSVITSSPVVAPDEMLLRIPDYGRGQLNSQEWIKIESYLQKALELSYHPLGRMVQQLGDVYRGTYVGVGAHPRLLPHAIAEIHSYIKRMYNFVRILFPALPPEDRPIHLDTPDDELPRVVSANTLLLPVLLPRLYPSLFTLYVLHNQKQDDLYWDRLQKWNRQSDLALMNFLGVDAKFFIEENANGNHFSGAVDCLQQLSTTFSPSEKLNVIHKTFKEVSRAVQAHLGSDFLWNMDDLFPVFLFVVVRSRIRHLGTEIHLIDDLIDKNITHGELELMFTTLEASYKYIQYEKITFT